MKQNLKIFDDFAVFKDVNETQIIIQDASLQSAGAGIIVTFGSEVKLNFRTLRRSTAESKVFDMVICSKNNAPEAD